MKIVSVVVIFLLSLFGFSGEEINSTQENPDSLVCSCCGAPEGCSSPNVEDLRDLPPSSGGGAGGGW